MALTRRSTAIDPVAQGDGTTILIGERLEIPSQKNPATLHKTTSRTCARLAAGLATENDIARSFGDRVLTIVDMASFNESITVFNFLDMATRVNSARNEKASSTSPKRPR